jgi:hypothetical protein
VLIKDDFLKKDSLIDLTTETIIPFTINNDPASFLSNRFRLVLQTTKVLPLVLTDVEAFRKENGIQVEWFTQTEKGIEKYEIEKSANGQLFEKAQTVEARNNAGLQNNYVWFDANPIPGNNFYRIRCIQKNGEPFYTRQVVVNIKKMPRSTTVFPNPVKGNLINLTLRNLERGDYTVTLINSFGRTVYAKIIRYNGTTEHYTINIRKIFSKGNYSLTITNGSDIFINNVMID